MNDKVKIDNITEIIGTGPDNIKIFPNFLRKDEIDEALAIANLYPHKPDAYHSYFLGSIPEYDTSNHKQNTFFTIIGNKMMEHVRSVYPGLEFIQDKGIGIVVHPTGTYIDPHTDILEFDMTKDDYETHTFASQLEKFPYLWSGHLSVLIYLNDNYSGGELYFPDHNISISPNPGDIITFPGNAHYIHGVKPITDGIRYTISQWCKFKDFVSK